MTDLVALFGVLGMFGLPALIVVITVGLKHKERMELIRQGIRPEEGVPRYPSQASLFLGLLFIGLGIGGIAVGLWKGHNVVEPGFLLTGAGIALIGYWRLTRADRERKIRFIEEFFVANKSKTPDVVEEKTAALTTGDDVEK